MGYVTSVPARMAPGFPGMLADSTRLKDAVTGTSEEASAEIPFGTMVRKGTLDNGVLKLTAITNQLVGIVVHDHAFAPDIELGLVGLKPKVTMSILNRGRIWVATEEAVVPGDLVFVRAVAVGNEVAGSFRKTQDTTDCINISSIAKWVRSSVNGIAVLEIDMINSRVAAPA